DTTGVYTTVVEATARVMGAGPGLAGFSSGDSCANTANDAYKNMLGGGTPEPHGANQNNAGPTCSAVGHPVNVTNGNMWVSEHDYALPGAGDSIKVDRYYNSITQQGGIFGWGWKTDLDESIISNSGGEDILVMTGTGRGMYF